MEPNADPLVKHSSRHRYRSPLKRGVLSLLIVSAILFAGTLGIHRFEGMSYLDAFYFMSMIATAQGPSSAPHTAEGKLFVAFMSFVSVGAAVASLGFLFGPFFGELWKIGHHKFEQEAHTLDEKRRHKA